MAFERIALCLAALVLSSCDTGLPAQPTVESGAPVATTRNDVSVDDAATIGDAGSNGSDVVTYGLCPDAMAATFPSIFTQMLSTGSCGTNRPYDCHSTTGALPQAEGGTGSLLDFSIDAAAVYAELLGADAGGYPSVNIAGDAGGVVLRVAPGDASASLLYIKLALPTATDPRFGKAMPPTQSVCPTALDTVKAWIDMGATAQ